MVLGQRSHPQQVSVTPLACGRPIARHKDEFGRRSRQEVKAEDPGGRSSAGNGWAPDDQQRARYVESVPARRIFLGCRK